MISVIYKLGKLCWNNFVNNCYEPLVLRSHSLRIDICLDKTEIRLNYRTNILNPVSLTLLVELYAIKLIKNKFINLLSSCKMIGIIFQHSFLMLVCWIFLSLIAMCNHSFKKISKLPVFDHKIITIFIFYSFLILFDRCHS